MTGIEKAVEYGVEENLAREICAVLPEKYHPEKWTATEWRNEAQRFRKLGPERYGQTLQLLEGLRQNYEQWARRGQRATAEQTADLSAPYRRHREETGWSAFRPEDRKPRQS